VRACSQLINCLIDYLIDLLIGDTLFITRIMPGLTWAVLTMEAATLLACYRAQHIRRHDVISHSRRKLTNLAALQLLILPAPYSTHMPAARGCY